MYHGPEALSAMSASLAHVAWANDVDFGFNPRAVGMFDADGKLIEWDGEAPPATLEPFGPPDLLTQFMAVLDSREEEAETALWTRSGAMVGRRTLAELGAINAVLAPLLVADPPHRKHAIGLVEPPLGVLLGLAQLLPTIRGARRAIRYLLDRRRDAAVRRSCR